MKKKLVAVIAAAITRAAARRGEERCQRSVLVQAEQKGENYG